MVDDGKKISRRVKTYAMAVQTYNIEMRMNGRSLDFWTSLLTQSQGCYNSLAKSIVSANVPLQLKVVHKNFYHAMRADYPMLPSQSVIKIEQEVIGALKSQRKNKHRGGEIPTKKGLSMCLDKRLYSRLSQTGIEITGEVRNKRTLYEFVLYPKVEEMLRTCTTCDPLLFIRGGRAFLSVPFNVAELPVLTEQSIGVDLGERRLFVTSEGVAFRDSTYLRERRKTRYLRKCLQSKGTKSAKRHLKKISHREHHLWDDMCKRAANALLQSTEAGVIVMEDLSGLKKKTSRIKSTDKKNTSKNRRASQVPYYMFRQTLTNKAPLYGKRVETVSPEYTSQTDSLTGKTDGVRRNRRYYSATGLVLDSDWNAAVNIAVKGRHPVSKPTPKDGGLVFLDGQGAVNRPNAGRMKTLPASPSL